MFGLGSVHAAIRLFLLLGCPLYAVGCIGVWPLGVTQLKDESKVQTKILYPTNDDCFEEGSGHVQNDYYTDVLRFTGKRRSFVDIEINKVDKVLDRISISFSLFAEKLLSGTLFHYRSKTNVNGQFNAVKVDLSTQGKITVRYCKDRNCVNPMVHDVQRFVKKGEWYQVILYRNEHGVFKSKIKHDGKEYKGSDDEQYKGNNKIYWNTKHGDVRIGGHLDEPIGRFVGRLSCVSMMPENPAKCSWPKIEYFLNGKCNCQKERVCTKVAIKFLWPLNNKSKGYETIKRIHPTSPSSSMNFLPEEAIKGSLNMTTYSVESQFITSVSYDEEMGTRLTVALFVKPTNLEDTWTIIKVKPSEGYYSQLTVQLESNKFKAILSSSGNAYISVYSSTTISAGTWYFVAAQVNSNWKELSLIVDEQFNSTSFVPGYRPTSQNAKPLVEIVIGDDPPPTSVRGQVACVSIFNAPLEETSAAMMLKDECNQRKYTYTAPVENDPKPIRIWPLSKRSYGYEVIGSTGMTNPPDDLCWRFNNENTLDPIDSEAVKFYGYDRFSLKIASTDSILEFFTMGLFLKPEMNISGTIIEVKFNSGLTTHILSVELILDQLNVKLEADGQSCSELSSLGNTLTGDEWTLFVIQGKSGGNFKLLYDATESPFNRACTTAEPPFAVSDISLGKPFDVVTSTTGFLGWMRCLAMFNKSLPTERFNDILTHGCDSVNTESRPVGTLCYLGDNTCCFAFRGALLCKGTTKPLNLATAVWKLDNSPPNGKRKSDMSKLNSNTSLVFDGSSLLHVLVDLNLTTDMSLGLFIRPSKYPKGTILKSSSQPKLDVSIEQTTIFVSFNTSNPECPTLKFHGVQPLSWHLLVIRRISECNSLVVTLNNEVKKTLGDCFPIDQNTVMAVRLGGEPRSFNNFRGELSCLAVFDVALPVDITEESMVKSCNENHGNNDTLTVEADGYDTPSSITAKYRRVQSNSVPQESTGTLGTRVAKSVPQCTKHCNLQGGCRSFTFNRPSAECTLFNFITIDGLKSKTDADYYAMLYTDFL